MSEARRAADSGWIEGLGRAGLAAQGISYAIVGILAAKLAFGNGGKATGREGALHTLAQSGWGKTLLVLLAIGFAGYALWRFAQAFFDRGDEGSDRKGLGKRASQLAKGLLYAGLTYGALESLSGGGGGGESGQKQATAGVLGWTGGKWIVLAAALGVAAAAVWNVYRGVSKKFAKDVRTDEMGQNERKLFERVGEIGLSARGIVFGVIAWFLAKAALEYDPKKSIGIGGALSKLANAPYGPWLLGATAAGLIAFGAFCCFQARYRQV